MAAEWGFKLCARPSFLLRSDRQCGIAVAIDEPRAQGIVPEWLNAGPMRDREIRVGSQEEFRFLARFVEPSHLRERSCQQAPRRRAIGFRMVQSFDRGIVVTERIVGLALHPIVPAGRMRVEPQRALNRRRLPPAFP
jgi:hypothetical protein